MVFMAELFGKGVIHRRGGRSGGSNLWDRRDCLLLGNGKYGSNDFERWYELKYEHGRTKRE